MGRTGSWGGEEGYRYTALRNRSRWLHLRQLSSAQTQRGTERKPQTLSGPSPKDCLPTKRTGVQGAGLGVGLPRDMRFPKGPLVTGALQFPPPPLPPPRNGRHREAGAGPLARSSRTPDASALVLPVRGRKCRPRWRSLRCLRRRRWALVSVSAPRVELRLSSWNEVMADSKEARAEAPPAGSRCSGGAHALSQGGV